MENILSEGSANQMERRNSIKFNAGAKVALALGAFGLSIVTLAIPFILPAFRQYCLPYLPATTQQLANLSRAFEQHAIRGRPFIDIGSGKGDIVLLAARHGHLFSTCHGVELNPVLVLLSRLYSLKLGRFSQTKFYCRDLWKFNLDHYDNICIFGVDTMMSPLEDYILATSTNEKRIFACRFPFAGLPLIESHGKGVDTVWVYHCSPRRIDGPR